MKDFFNMDGPLMSALSKVADLMILNLLFIVCSIPVITMGASFTALSYVTLKLREGQDGYVARSFFHAFKTNFRQATLTWLIFLAAALVLFLDMFAMRSFTGTLGTVIRISVWLGVLIWCMGFLYVFPLTARFENTVKQTLKNAQILAIANAPKTLAMLVIVLGSVILTFWNARTIGWGVLAWILIGFALVSYINSIFQVPVFHRLAETAD